MFSNQPLSLSDGGKTGYFHCLSRSRVDRLPPPSLENRASLYPRYEHVTPSLYPRYKHVTPSVVPKVHKCEDQDTSIGDLVTQSVSQVLISEPREH